MQVVTGILKYVPQVVLNIRRRSTTGWTIWNVILDLTGGLLSVVQASVILRSWMGSRGMPRRTDPPFRPTISSLCFTLISVSEMSRARRQSRPLTLMSVAYPSSVLGERCVTNAVLRWIPSRIKVSPWLSKALTLQSTLP